jgi:short-subunit dehydrogenase
MPRVLLLPAADRALLGRAAERQVELLVNNAGVATYGPFASAPAEGQRGLVRLNVETIVALTRGLLPQMIARGRGGVINVSTEFTEVAGSGEPERRLTHLQPRRVVESGLRAHARGRTVTVVGPFYEFLTFAGRFAPRALLRRMMGRQLRPAPQHPTPSPDAPPP